MNRSSMKNSSETNWERIDAMTDEEIDLSDIPALDESFFSHATLRMPRTKVTVAIDMDADILEWFEAQGDEYQRRMNAALRIYVEAHKQ